MDKQQLARSMGSCKLLLGHTILSRFIWIILFLNFVTFNSCKNPQELDAIEDHNPGFFTSIQQSDQIDAYLVFDLDSVMQNRDNEIEVQGTFYLNDCHQLQVPVELRSRGVTRKGMCDFPPLRVQLKKSALLDNDLGPYRNYKLVTHCMDSTSDDQLLHREFITYQLYQELTEFSFRTQLLNLRYFMSDDTITHYAFLIENESEMNQRLDVSEVDVEKTGLKSVNLDQYKLFVLFQYMIGNTDWNLNGGHNTKFVLQGDSQSPKVIPYDFDYCGLVNASYAIPHPTIPIDHIRDRHFMYRGKKSDDFTETRDLFLKKKTLLFSRIQTYPHLSDSHKTDMTQFLIDFFEIIEQKNWKDHLFA